MSSEGNRFDNRLWYCCTSPCGYGLTRSSDLDSFRPQKYGLREARSRPGPGEMSSAFAKSRQSERWRIDERVVNPEASS